MFEVEATFMLDGGWRGLLLSPAESMLEADGVGGRDGLPTSLTGSIDTKHQLSDV